MVCLQRSVFCLTEGMVLSLSLSLFLSRLKQGNTWQSFSGFSPRQSVREELREVADTSRWTGNICTPPGLVLKVPKPLNNNSSVGSAGYFGMQTIENGSAKGYLDDALVKVEKLGRGIKRIFLQTMRSLTGYV